MSHLDEGTLHALLDGELETNEVAEIQAHLGSCSACGLRLREVKEFLAEADRLIASVDLGEAAGVAAAPRPGPTPIAPLPAQAEPEAQREPPPGPQPPAPEPAKWEPWNEPPPPVLLIPDNESGAERRMRRMRRFGWAAMIAAIAGAGWLEARKMIPITVTQSDTAPAANAVVSPEETARPDQPVNAFAYKHDSAPETVARKPAAAPRPTAPLALKAPPPEAKAEAAPAGDDSVALNESSIDSLADSGTEKATADSAAATDLASVRARASQALEELDRERRRKQAAAATAALDRQRRPNAPAPAAVAPTPPPAPPTLEQRAQVYLRIGLDEAARQLGGPAHVIEGLSSLFMGLVQAGVVPGADPARPVVRVVYQDSQGRLILLDQQRIRAGQAAPPASPLAWSLGEIAMWLHGEASSEILRTYRPRVR